MRPITIKSKKKYILLVIYLLSLLIIYSCENDLEAIQKITFDTNTPDETTKDLHIMISDSGYAKVEIIATLAETFRNKTHITKVKDSLRVNFFNDKGKVISTLFALYGEINFTNGTIIVKDSVRLYNFKNKQMLETEALYWNQRDSTIYSLSQIIVRSPKGIVIGKDGIKTTQEFNKYELLKPEGKIQIEEELEIN
jgi:LPS export ABC transporter protein LptC